MLVEALVLGSENGVLHHLRNRLNVNHRPALFAKFANKKAVCGINTQRDFGAIVGQDVE